MKKDLALIGGLFLAIIALLIFGGGLTSTSYLKSTTGQNTTTSAEIFDELKVNGTTFKLIVSKTPDEHKKGLANIESLPLDTAMLFVFSKSDKYVIWMKDMKFAIDIIWIDKNKQIVDIARNVPPEPNTKDADLTRYTPKDTALYVFEINAGLATLNNIKIGDKVEF